MRDTSGLPAARPGAGVLLDVDGTLIDSTYLHALAWWRGLRDIGEWAPMHEIHRLVGMGGEQLVTELLGEPKRGASAAWRRRYDEVFDEVRPFPGATDLVTRLSELGFAVVLATSSPKDLLDRAVDLLDVGSFVTATTSSDDVSSAKPAPDVFEVAIDRGVIDPHRAAAIGDSVFDVQAARAAGIACVGLESGGFSRHELSEEGAIAVYRNPRELVMQLMTSPVATLLT